MVIDLTRDPSTWDVIQRPSPRSNLLDVPRKSLNVASHGCHIVAPCNEVEGNITWPIVEIIRIAP